MIHTNIDEKFSPGTGGWDGGDLCAALMIEATNTLTPRSLDSGSAKTDCRSVTLKRRARLGPVPEIMDSCWDITNGMALFCDKRLLPPAKLVPNPVTRTAAPPHVNSNNCTVLSGTCKLLAYSLMYMSENVPTFVWF